MCCNGRSCSFIAGVYRPGRALTNVGCILLIFGFPSVVFWPSGGDAPVLGLDAAVLLPLPALVEPLVDGVTGLDPGSALTNVGWILLFFGVGCSFAEAMIESPSRSVLDEVFGDAAVPIRAVVAAGDEEEEFRDFEKSCFTVVFLPSPVESPLSCLDFAFEFSFGSF